MQPRVIGRVDQKQGSEKEQAAGDWSPWECGFLKKFGRMAADCMLLVKFSDCGQFYIIWLVICLREPSYSANPCGLNSALP